MITISVGAQQVSAEQFTGGWLLEQLERRSRERDTNCVQVSIETADINVTLVTPECRTSGRGRPLSPREREVLELWRKHRLTETGWEPGGVVAFLKQVERIL